MSKKRTSSASINDEQTDEDSESPAQREGDAKRAKLDPESDTTLQDLPPELLEGILVKTVVMEVKDLKLAKSVWKEKTEQVISRLGTISSLWGDILTTNSFRTKLHRILDGTAQTIRLEILHQSSMSWQRRAMTTLMDKVFILYRLLPNEHQDFCYAINVYNRDNMEEVKEVIPLPGTNPKHMTGCNMSNCVYVCVGLRQEGSFLSEVLRISRDGGAPKFSVSTLISDHRRFIETMTVSANGNLTILAMSYRFSDAVSIYNSDGTLKHETMLSRDMEVGANINAFEKSSGNVVVAYTGGYHNRTRLLELDESGGVVRRFQSSFEISSREVYVNLADENDRMMIASSVEGIELLDSEFNLLGLYSLPKDHGQSLVSDLHYDCNRNEIVRIHLDQFIHPVLLNICVFRFTEEGSA